MKKATDNKSIWSRYYEKQKKVWYDPNVSVYTKAVVRIVELHRSDSMGWSISVRKIATLLGISNNTALKYINDAIKRGLIESSPSRQRKRRKLRLSVSLRAPIEFESPSSRNLSHWKKQAVSQADTPIVSGDEPLNNKGITTIRINRRLRKESINRLLIRRD